VKKTSSYIYSTIGISLVLFLLGTIGWMVLNGRALSREFKSNIELQVIMHDQTRDVKARQLEEILRKQSFVKAVEYISKEKAMENYIKEKDEDFMASGLLDFNPLYISINMKLQPEYINPDSLNKVIAFVQQSNIVREVVYDKKLVSKLDSNLRKIGIILAVIAIILFAAAIVIIDNTVRLAMFSNRLLIKTMQMVGATRWFIAKPFNKRAILTGFLSGVVAILGLLILKYSIENQVPEMRVLNDTASLVLLLAGIIALGVLISLISTHRSVFKYLKLKIDDLY